MVIRMEEYEIDRASQRANLIEQRMFDLTLNSIDTLKHSTAVELRKAQNEMKKRLHRYRNRQREIVKSRPPSDKDPIEELMTRRIMNKAKEKKQRPQTCPAKVQTSKSKKSLDTDSDSDIEIDGSFMIDQQRSKIDLRPKTSMAMYRTGKSLDNYIRVGRLGSAIGQIRYFDEDELKDRGHFYKHLVNKRIVEEKNKLHTLNDKVAEFCGADTIQTMNQKMQTKRNWFGKPPDVIDNKRPATTATNATRMSRRPQSSADKKGVKYGQRQSRKSSSDAVITRPNTSRSRESARVS